jgi:hypothetical protein
MAGESGNGTRFLQAISSEALLQQLPIEEARQSFVSLPPIAQANLFSDLLSQHRELQQEHRKLQREQDSIEKTIDRMPSADHHVAFNRRRLNKGTDYEDDACELADTFCEIWQIRDGPLERDYARDGPVLIYYQSHDLIRWSEDEPFRWMPFSEQMKQMEQSGYTRKPLYFSSAISSQLLLYRLCATFGPLPTQCGEPDWYKVCWEVYLVHKKEVDASVSTATNVGEANVDEANVDKRAPISKLTLFDYKGSATAAFYGSEEAAENALELINYLVGPTCAHTYDGCVAGCQA